MVEKKLNKNQKFQGKKASNNARSVLFFALLVLLAYAMVSSVLTGSNKLKEVALSDVVARAND